MTPLKDHIGDLIVDQKSHVSHEPTERQIDGGVKRGILILKSATKGSSVWPDPSKNKISMKKRTYVCCFVIIIFGFCCDHESGNEKVQIDLRDKSESIPYLTFVESIDYIDLNTNDSCWGSGTMTQAEYIFTLQDIYASRQKHILFTGF